MDLHELLAHFPSAETSYELTPSNIPAYPECMLGPAKFGFGSSPDSPLSPHFDIDNFSTLSNSLDQNSSIENLSGNCPAHNSALEIDSYFQMSPPDLQDSMQFSSVGTSYSCNGIRNMKDALQELKLNLLGPNSDEPCTPTSASGENHSRSWGYESHQDSPVASRQLQVKGQQQNSGYAVSQSRHPTVEKTQPTDMLHFNLKQLLIACAQAVSENRIGDFERLIEKARSAVSISGEPIERLGAYMLEGLVARQEASGSKIYQALQCDLPGNMELLSSMRILYEICPYVKFGYMAANGAIAEAFRNEDNVHIIDFRISLGVQWLTLIQALAARPGGPPHLRITGVDDPVSKYARGDGLQAVGNKLAAWSREFNIPLEFNPIHACMKDVKRDMIDVRPGEAVAVSVTLELHHLPDESVAINNPRDNFLRMVKSLSPKVFTLVEQESNTNTTPFLSRFKEALDFYHATFDSIDVTLPRDSKDRINVEQHCLARDIVNIIACEGQERVERHELLGKWRSRLSMAGFKPYPLSSHVNSVIRTLLRSYSENYSLVVDGAMLLGWKERNLISASAWH